MLNLYEDFAPPTAKFSIGCYWIDRTRKTTPVLVISQITYENLMPGEYRLIKVVPLPSGWKSHPSTQTFADGNFNSGGDGFTVGYNAMGQLELTTLSTGSTTTITESYAWDGKMLSIVPEKRVTHDPFADNAADNAPAEAPEK